MVTVDIGSPGTEYYTRLRQRVPISDLENIHFAYLVLHVYVYARFSYTLHSVAGNKSICRLYYFQSYSVLEERLHLFIRKILVSS